MMTETEVEIAEEKKVDNKIPVHSLNAGKGNRGILIAFVTGKKKNIRNRGETM